MCYTVYSTNDPTDSYLWGYMLGLCGPKEFVNGGVQQQKIKGDNHPFKHLPAQM